MLCSPLYILVINMLENHISYSVAGFSFHTFNNIFKWTDILKLNRFGFVVFPLMVCVFGIMFEKYLCSSESCEDVKLWSQLCCLLVALLFCFSHIGLPSYWNAFVLMISSSNQPVFHYIFSSFFPQSWYSTGLAPCTLRKLFVSFFNALHCKHFQNLLCIYVQSVFCFFVLSTSLPIWHFLSLLFFFCITLLRTFSKEDPLTLFFLMNILVIAVCLYFY